MRFLKIILAVVAVLLVGGLAVFYSVSRSGTSAVEEWIGQQLQSIANSYLNPRLSFSDLDYEYPGTVSLRNLRLTADDPGSPGQTIDILACRRGTITLAEVPAAGKPIVIESVVLEGPLFSAIATAPGSGDLVGFTDLIRPSQPEQSGPLAPTAPAQTQPATRPLLSDYFRIRLIEITDGRVVYDPRIAGTDPMELDQISMKLKVDPAERGWYKVGTRIARDPIFDASIAGQLNIDDFSARDAVLKLQAELSDERLTYLPPQLQKVLKDHEVRGRANLLLMGDLPIARPLDGELAGELTLADANITFGQYRIPIGQLSLNARLQDHDIQVPAMYVQALGGTLSLSGSYALNDAMDAHLKLEIAEMRMEQLLASRKEGEPPTLAGKVQASVQAVASVRKIIDAANGRPVSPPLPQDWAQARIRVSEARLVKVRAIDLLNRALSAATRIIPGASSASRQPAERFEVELKFRGDKADVTDLAYVGDTIAARGSGTIGLDGQLNLLVNAGPVEKMTSLLGKTIGSMASKTIALITDNVVAYTVTGRLSDPKVGVQVAGGAAGKVGQGLEKIGQDIGGALEKKEK